jgi:hypothetical protein
LAVLIRHRDARVRALACELAGLRHENERYVQALGHALADRNGTVSAAARLALRRITGRDFWPGQLGQRELESYLREHPLNSEETVPKAAEPPAVIPKNASPPRPTTSQSIAGDPGRDAASDG